MQNNRWLRPLLAFLITFGVLAMAASLLRAVAVYQRLFSRGMQLDDPSVANEATRELSKMDQLYTPTFPDRGGPVVGGGGHGLRSVAAESAKTDLPPPLPGRPASVESGTETR